MYTMPRLDVVILTPAGINPRIILDAHFPDGYHAGLAVFHTKQGGMKNQATMEEIDWEQTETAAQRLPKIFIDKDATLYSEETENTASESKDKLVKAWETALKTAVPTDFFTHWTLV